MTILGLSFGIDSAAAVVQDSDPVAAAAEERYDRKKHSRAFPAAAARACLQHAGVAPASVERVAFFWNPGEHVRSFDPRRAAGYRDHREYFELVPMQMFALAGDPGPIEECEQVFRFAGRRAPLHVHYFPHHLCHAAAAFYRSGFGRAAYLIADGYGERAALSMGVGEDLRLSTLAQLDYPNSIGAVYAAVTEHLGFKANSSEGTVMALASLGEPSFSAQFEELVRLEAEGRFSVDPSFLGIAPYSMRRCSDRFSQVFGPARQPGEELTDRHRDLAASLQLRTEEVLLHAARWLRDASGASRLVMAGGVALNSVANERILEEAGFEELFTFPAAGDAGAAVGAALLVAHKILGRPRSATAHTEYLGPDIGPGPAAVLRAAGQRFRSSADPALEAAEMVAAGKIVGWFQGRMELGPRALGNRTILADPRRPDTKDQLNLRVKHREPFRPFAPAVTEEDASRWFDGRMPSPFMTRVHRPRPGVAEKIPAVLHVDGTARVQTVSREQNPVFHGLLRRFEEVAGMPLLLNTSFNDHGEPIVCTVTDALRCFHSTGIDVLVAGDCIVEKRGEG